VTEYVLASPRNAVSPPEATGVSPVTPVWSSRLVVTESVWVGQPSASSVVSEREISSLPSAPTKTPGPSPGWQVAVLEDVYEQEMDTEPGNGSTGNGMSKSTGAGGSPEGGGGGSSPESGPSPQSPPRIRQTELPMSPASDDPRPVDAIPVAIAATITSMPTSSIVPCPDASRTRMSRTVGPAGPGLHGPQDSTLRRALGPGDPPSAA
jgi:hypothetical protein